MEEAIRTSVLTRRWCYLWTFTTRLEFDDVSVVNLLNAQPPIPTLFDLSQFATTYPPFLVQRRRFVDWVNQVLNLHKGTHLDEFSLPFAMYSDNFKRLHLIFICN